MAERNDFDVAVELKGVDVDATLGSDRVPLQRGAGAAGELLPRYEVGVVFEFGGDDDVARADGVFEPAIAEHVGDQVDRLGGVLGEHQLVRVGADERRDVGAALLVGVGGLLHQLVCTSVHGAVGGDEEIAFGVEDLCRPL